MYLLRTPHVSASSVCSRSIHTPHSSPAPPREPESHLLLATRSDGWELRFDWSYRKGFLILSCVLSKKTTTRASGHISSITITMEHSIKWRRRWRRPHTKLCVSQIEYQGQLRLRHGRWVSAGQMLNISISWDFGSVGFDSLRIAKEDGSEVLLGFDTRYKKF